MSQSRQWRAAVAGLGMTAAVLMSTGCGTDSQAVDLAANAPVASEVVDYAGGAQTDLPEEVQGEPVEGGPISVEIGGQVGTVVPIGLTEDGVLIPPADVSQTGWYLDSALPGSGGPGSVVLTGHINDVSQGWGFGSNFADISAGDRITLVTAGGGQVEYRAVADSEHDLKADGVAEAVNDFDGPETLVVVTCGGRYVGGDLGYESNIVTVFEPVLA